MVSLIVFSILIIVHEFGHFIVAKRMGVRVEKFSLGFGPQLLKKKKDNTEYSISAIPLGGYVKLAGDNIEEYKGNADEYLSRPPGQRALIVFFGPLLNYVLGFLCFTVIFFMGAPSPEIASLIDGFGAKDAGVEVGDRILAVDGKKIYFWEQLQNIIYGKKSSELIRLSILRGNQKHIISVKIKEKKIEGLKGKEVSIGLIGITPQLKHGFSQSLLLAVNKTYGLTILVCNALWRILTGQLSLRETLSGPLVIYDITEKAAKLGFDSVINLMGILSLGLSIFNILPIPVLDGGHLFLLGIEKIRKKPLGQKTEEFVTRSGLIFIVLLVIFVFYNDMVKIGWIQNIMKFFQQ